MPRQRYGHRATGPVGRRRTAAWRPGEPRRRRWHRLLGILAAALLLAGGCRRGERPKKSAPPVPEPIVPTAAASSSSMAEAPWLGGLPDGAVAVAAGDAVWATVPEPGLELARVGVFRVDAIAGKSADLVDKMGKKVREVPAALIHPVGSAEELKAGEVALCYSLTTPGVLARVVKVRRGQVQVQYDWAGATKEAVVDHAEPPREGVAPLAFVAYPKFANRSKGLVVALSETKAWVQTSSGHVEIHPRAKLTALEIRSSPYRVGDRVQAYAWTTGIEPGTVREVLEPRVRYSVQLEGDRPPGSYFFADLVPAH